MNSFTTTTEWFLDEPDKTTYTIKASKGIKFTIRE